MVLEIVKHEIIQRAKQHYSQLIYKQYPQHKQTNHALGIVSDADELAAMKTFIGAKRSEIETIESDIAALENTSIVDEFLPNSDENMKIFVTSKLPNLTTDDQKLAVISAIQNIKK